MSPATRLRTCPSCRLLFDLFQLEVLNLVPVLFINLIVQNDSFYGQSSCDKLIRLLADPLLFQTFQILASGSF